MIWQTLEKASFSELSFFLSLTLVLLILFWMRNYLKIAYCALQMPGPKAYPLIGNSLLAAVPDHLPTLMGSCYNDYGPIFRVWLGIFPTFVMTDPEHLQKILGSSKHVDKTFIYSLLHNFLGDGLITSSGDKWHSHRKYLQPAFHLSILESFIRTFAASASCLKDKLNVYSNTQVNITSFINECVIDILNEAVLGVPIGGKSMEESPFRRGKVMAPHRVANPWLMFGFIYKLTQGAVNELNQKKELDDFTRKMIRKRKQEKSEGIVNENKSLLDYMIEISENNEDFTEDDIINEACTFMLAGQDSVGASLAFSIFLLAQHQDHQDKCIEEIDNIFGSDDRPPSMSDLKNMKHLEMCIKEALRMYPAVPLIMRKLREDVSFGKKVLPSGSEIFIIPYCTHRIDHIYPKPNEYIPERFLPENCEKRSPYAFLPFSAGPRNCIGYKFAMIEMKTIISTLLRNYRIMPVEGKTRVEPLFRVTLRAKGGLWVKFEPRLVE